MENSHSLIGKMLGNCRIEQLIGRGGHAAVFLATQVSLQRAVAVKVLLPQVEMHSRLHANFLARFKREASLIARLNHINIMHIYDYGEQSGLAYLIIPYYPGGSLRDLLKGRGPVSPRQALVYIEQIASALDYAHQQGVIHRDLKPANFLLDSDSRLLLADFGIAHIMESVSTTTLTSTGLVLGTPEYMAPEMIEGRPVDLRTDIYELGIVLFHLLSGRTPFHSTSAYSTMIMHLTEPVPLLSTIQPGVPATVDAVIRKATMKDPEQRFRSAGEMAHALRIAIDGAELLFTSAEPEAGPQAQSSFIMLPASHTLSPTFPGIATNNTPLVSAPVPSSPAQRRGFPLPWLLFLLLAVVGISTTGVLLAMRLNLTDAQTSTPTPTITVTPALTSAQIQVKDTLQRYYDQLNNRDYQSAYSLWQTNPQPQYQCDVDPGFTTFTNNFSETEKDQITFDAPPTILNDRAIVRLTLQSTETTGGGVRNSTYYEQYQMVQQNGTWKIKSGGHYKGAINGAATPPTFPGATLSQQAQAIVQQYYDSINQHDYPKAYSLLGNGFQNNDPYCRFATGYQVTHHDAITVNNVTPTNDGAVVLITIVATEDNPTTGTTIQHTYNWKGIVGQQNNQQKILSAVANLIT